MIRRRPMRRRRSCGARREGNVVPLTSLDRQTGSVALDASDNVDAARVANEPAPPAGSRDSERCSPPLGERRGGSTAHADHESRGATEGGHILRSYSENKCPSRTPGLNRPTWTARLERATTGFRSQCALRHRGRARLAEDRGQASAAHWHRTRAAGQQRRFEAVAECGQRELVVQCQDCGHSARRLEARCGHYRLCVACRAQRANNYRTKFGPARSRALRQTTDLRRSGAPGGEWGERFITLTLPHSGDVRRDLRTLPIAWRRVRASLWAFFKDEHHFDSELLKRIAYMRVTEVTPGTDGDGHAHLHVYMLSPYIPHELVRHLWGKAIRASRYDPPTRLLEDVLAEARSERSRAQLARVLVTRRGANGRPLLQVDWPVADIRATFGDIENELVKYLVKDAEFEDGSLRLVDPDLYARIYEGLEGVRTIATSRHFFLPEDRTCACTECGSTRVSTKLAKPEEPPKSGEEGSDP